MLGGAIGSLTNKRPEYEIPDSLRQSLSLAKAAFLDPKMSGYEQAAESIDMQTANQLAAATQGGRGAESVAALAGQQQAAYRDLEAQNQLSQDRDRAGLTSELAKVAQAEDMAWQMNEFAPYKDKAQRSADVFGAGMENVVGALDDYGIASVLGGGQTKATQATQAQYGTPGGKPAPDAVMALMQMLSKAGQAKMQSQSLPWDQIMKALKFI